MVSRKFLHFRNLQILGFRMVPSSSHEIYLRSGHSLVIHFSVHSVSHLEAREIDVCRVVHRDEEHAHLRFSSTRVSIK